MGHWSFFGPGSETKWNATDTFKPGGEWDRVAELMMNDLRESGHPIFRATSALDRGHLKNKASGKLSIHFCADYVAIETIYRTFVSVHQLCQHRDTQPTRSARCFQSVVQYTCAVILPVVICLSHLVRTRVAQDP